MYSVPNVDVYAAIQFFAEPTVALKDGASGLQAGAALWLLGCHLFTSVVQAPFFASSALLELMLPDWPGQCFFRSKSLRQQEAAGPSGFAGRSGVGCKPSPSVVCAPVGYTGALPQFQSSDRFRHRYCPGVFRGAWWLALTVQPIVALRARMVTGL